MLNELLQTGPRAFDIINPISEDFYLYQLPEGGLLTYGWKFDGPPKVGQLLAWQEDGPVGGWVTTTVRENAKWEIEKVTTYSRDVESEAYETALGDEAVMRVSLCGLKALS